MINKVLGNSRFNGKQNLTPAHFFVEIKFNLTTKDKEVFLMVIDFQK